jgi:hypothetical protein
MGEILGWAPQSPPEGLPRTVRRAFGAAHGEQRRRAALRSDRTQIQEGRCDMDVITQIRLLWLGGLGTLTGVALATAWLLGVWQHRREQRRLRLLESLQGQFPVEIRDRIALQVHGTMFGRRVAIRVDPGGYAPEAWWSIVAGLYRSLSPDVGRLMFSKDAPPLSVIRAIIPRRR